MNRSMKSLLTFSMLAVVGWGIGMTKVTFAEESARVHYKTIKVGDLDIFFREAGPKDARRCCCFTASQLVRRCFAT